MSTDYSHLFALSTAEKLRLVEALWDDIAAHPEELPIPQWQIDELERREQEYLKNPSATMSWEEVKQAILKRHE